VVLILIQANQDLEAPIGTDQIERAREVTSEDVSLAPDTDRSCDRTEVVLILIQANQDL